MIVSRKATKAVAITISMAAVIWPVFAQTRGDERVLTYDALVDSFANYSSMSMNCEERVPDEIVGKIAGVLRKLGGGDGDIKRIGQAILSAHDRIGNECSRSFLDTFKRATERNINELERLI